MNHHSRTSRDRYRKIDLGVRTSSRRRSPSSWGRRSGSSMMYTVIMFILIVFLLPAYVAELRESRRLAAEVRQLKSYIDENRLAENTENTANTEDPGDSAVEPSSAPAAHTAAAEVMSADKTVVSPAEAAAAKPLERDEARDGFPEADGAGLSLIESIMAERARPSRPGGNKPPAASRGISTGEAKLMPNGMMTVHRDGAVRTEIDRAVAPVLARGFGLLVTGDSEAIETFQAITTELPDWAYGYYYRGIARLDRDDMATACDMLLALREGGDDAEATVYLLSALIIAGRYDEAERWLQEIKDTELEFRDLMLGPLFVPTDIPERLRHRIGEIEGFPHLQRISW